MPDKKIEEIKKDLDAQEEAKTGMKSLEEKKEISNDKAAEASKDQKAKDIAEGVPQDSGKKNVDADSASDLKNLDTRDQFHKQEEGKPAETPAATDERRQKTEERVQEAMRKDHGDEVLVSYSEKDGVITVVTDAGEFSIKPEK